MTKAKSTSEAALGRTTEGSTARTEAPTLTTGRTLDALIAEKVFGARWEFVSVGNVVARLVAPLPMDWILASQYGDGTVIHAARAEVLPYYSTDIAAALSVLEGQMATPGFRVLISCSGAGTYDVEWSVMDDDAPDDSGWLCIAEVCDAATLPLAICLAATQPLLVFPNNSPSVLRKYGLGAT